ncbi:MAG: indolepyruvate oxidoreductase subunit beta [Bacteroidales bacterium]|nr:indolepyruvate oxidoreductase subunit beta [Bacteroidales bacterium]
MKTDIILAGVGGQGILSIAAVIGMAAMNSRLHVKQSEVHGMSQRGGAVQSHLRLSDKDIHSDLIPAGACDLILSVEPMESLRYLPFLDESGWLITNSKPFINIPSYPDLEMLYSEINSVSNSILLDADDIAKEIGSRKVSNIVMLGAASSFLHVDFNALEDSVRHIFGRKGDELVKMNIDALIAGKNAAAKVLK